MLYSKNVLHTKFDILCFYIFLYLYILVRVAFHGGFYWRNRRCQQRYYWCVTTCWSYEKVSNIEFLLECRYFEKNVYGTWRMVGRHFLLHHYPYNFDEEISCTFLILFLNYVFDGFLKELSPIQRAKKFPFHARATEMTKNLNIIFFKFCRYLNILKNQRIIF